MWAAQADGAGLVTALAQTGKPVVPDHTLSPPEAYGVALALHVFAYATLHDDS